MRLRTSSLVTGVGLALVVVVVLLVLYRPDGPPPETDRDFLEQLRGDPRAIKQSAEGSGALPPESAAEDRVANIDMPKIVEFGKISNKEPAVKEVKVVNTGKAPLQIPEVKITCACLLGKMKDTVVPPGGHTMLKVTILPNLYYAFRLQKDLYIYTNDPDAPLVSLTVTAEVDPEFSLEPEEANFGELQKGDVVRKTLLFRQVGPEPVDVVGLKQVSKSRGLFLSHWRRPEQEWSDPKKPEYFIEVGLDTNETPDGNYMASFDILTTCKRIKAFSVLARAKVSTFYTLNPRTLIWRGTTDDRDTNMKVSASLTSDGPLEVTDVNISNKEFVVAAKRDDTGKVVHLEVSVAPTAPPGHKQGFLTFSVKNGERAVRDQVEVYAVLSKAPAS